MTGVVICFNELDSPGQKNKFLNLPLDTLDKNFESPCFVPMYCPRARRGRKNLLHEDMPKYI